MLSLGASLISAQEMELLPAPVLSPEQLTALEGKAEAPPTRSNLVVDITNRQAVVNFYNNTYVPTLNPAIGWTGTLTPCNPGTTNQNYRDMSLQMINYYRAMAQLPGNIVFDAAKNSQCQDAALLMIKNGLLTHFPGSGLPCYTADAATAAAGSNLAIGNHGPAAILNGYMIDSGTNNIPVPHRRWILYPPQTTMGIGDTNAVNGSFTGSNVLWVFGPHGSRPATPTWVSWPPPGFVPFQNVYPRWSFSRNAARTNVESGTVTMTLNGNPVGLTVIHRSSESSGDDNYGDDSIVWEPTGIVMGAGQPDRTYVVTITNVLIGNPPTNPETFVYNVTIIDPANAPTPTPSPTPTPTTTPTPTPTPSPSPTPTETPTPTPTPTPLQDADNTGGTIPAQLAAGYPHPATITMTNTGATTWTQAANYSLAILSDTCSLLAPETRLPMPAGTIIGPTQSHTFNMLLQTPGTNGPCTLQFQMIEEFVAFFGETVTVNPDVVTPIKNSQIMSHTIPATMPTTAGFYYSVNIKNLGNMTWRPNGRFILDATSDACGLIQNAVIVPEDVAPNQSRNFPIYLTSPSSPQTCHLELSMHEDSSVAAVKQELFGNPPTPFGATLILDIDIEVPENKARSWATYE